MIEKGESKMAHEVETMFSVREKPWHYEMTKDVTKIIQEAPTSEEALKAAGLDWNVEAKPIFTADGVEIPNYKANTRDKDGKVLGLVTDRYKVVQNSEAFAFTDELIGNGVKYETAGSLYGGKKVWLLAKMPEVKVAGDKTEPYVCFTNAHDGTGSIRVCMTPVRVVCNNTLNIALGRAKRAWSTIHVGNLEEKIMEAKRVLELAETYMDGLDKYANEMANVSVKFDDVLKIVNEIFPYKDDDSNRVKTNMMKARNGFMTCYYAKDIEKFNGTAWGVINAMADFADHTAPAKMTKNYQENNWGRIINGHQLVDMMVGAMNRVRGD